MQKAQKRNALRNDKFWFRKHITKPMEDGETTNGSPNQNGTVDEDECQLMTIDQIINGDGSFPGLVPLIHSYLASMDVDADTHCSIQQYLKLIQRRASGKLITMATWIRQEVLNHPEYKKDSVVSDQINYDILKKAKEIQEGVRECPELLGHAINTKTKDNIPTALQKQLSCKGC